MNMFNKIKNNIGFLLLVGLITSGCISVKEQKASILPQANISPKITNEDFARSDKFLSSIGTVPNEVLNADISYQWLDNGKELFYKFQEPSKTQYLKVNSATGQKTTLFDHEKMAKANIKRIGNKVQIVSAVLVPSKCPLFESLWILSADKTIPSSTKVIIINIIRPNKFITLFIQNKQLGIPISV